MKLDQTQWYPSRFEGLEWLFASVSPNTPNLMSVNDVTQELLVAYFSSSPAVRGVKAVHLGFTVGLLSLLVVCLVSFGGRCNRRV